MVNWTETSEKEAREIAGMVKEAEYKGPLVDAGTGPKAVIARALVKTRTPFVLGVEYDPDVAEKAKRYVEEAGLSSRIHVSQGDITDPSILDKEIPEVRALFEDVEDAPPMKDVYAGILLPANLWEPGIIENAIRTHIPPVATKDAIIYGAEGVVGLEEVEETFKGEYHVEEVGELICVYRNDFV